MRVLVATIIDALPSVLTVSCCLLYFVSIVAIICVSLFKGVMYQCTDSFTSARLSCVGSFVSDGTIEAPIWERLDHNFDNMGSAMLTVFEILVLERCFLLAPSLFFISKTLVFI